MAGRLRNPVTTVVVGVTFGITLAFACGERATKPRKRHRTAMEQRLQPAPTVDIRRTAERVSAGLDELERPYVFRWPLDNIDVTSPYGIRMHPVVRRLLYHSGIDFFHRMVPL